MSRHITVSQLKPWIRFYTAALNVFRDLIPLVTLSKALSYSGCVGRWQFSIEVYAARHASESRGYVTCICVLEWGSQAKLLFIQATNFNLGTWVNKPSTALK